MMSKMNPKVDRFLRETDKCGKEFRKLRAVIRACGLTEELKWGVPCYTEQNKNVVVMHGFKKYCALLFFKGVLMRDPEGILIQQTKNVQAARQIRFTNVREVTGMETILKAYISEAVEVERAGLKVRLKPTSEYRIPREFRRRLAEVPGLKRAFRALTPGRQRGYIFYFSQPKRSKTRAGRVEKSVRRILDGKGLND